MRLIEYHEEIAHGQELVLRLLRSGEPGKAVGRTVLVETCERRIQERLGEGSIGWDAPLKFGIPDAERIYRSPGMRAFYEANPDLSDRTAAVIYRDAPTGLILAEGLA